MDEVGQDSCDLELIGDNGRIEVEYSLRYILGFFSVDSPNDFVNSRPAAGGKLFLEYWKKH